MRLKKCQYLALHYVKGLLQNQGRIYTSTIALIENHTILAGIILLVLVNRFNCYGKNKTHA